MEIIVDNWADGEVSNCKMIIVRGSVMDHGFVASHENDQIAVSIGGAVSNWPTHCGVFKTVVSLNRGVNTIDFVYKNFNKTLILSFYVNDTDLCVSPLYIICKGHNGYFQASEECDNSVESACQRIALGTNLAQCLFAEKLRERGFKRRTFQLENDIDDKAPSCRVFMSQLNFTEAHELDQESLWAYFGREIMTSEIGSDKKKYLAFLSCTYWDGSKVFGDPALGGGGLALLGTATLHTWPITFSDIIRCFTDQRRIDGSQLMDNSCYRGTYGGCFSTSLGSVCHEIGHIFNLGHTLTGIMSRGFDNVERVFLAIPFPEVKGRTNIDEEKNLVLVPSFYVTSGPLYTSCKPEINHTIAPKQDDLTSFTPSCASILAHHEWFNDRFLETSPITFDSMRGIVSSAAGLKVVQLRGPTGSVIKSWELGTKSLHQHLIIPRLKLSSATLVAINSCGFILSKKI